MKLPSQAQLQAAGRHVVSYAAGGVTVAAGGIAIAYSMHGVSADQASALTDAVKQLASGLTSIVGALATLLSVGAAIWAARTASPQAQVQSAAAIPGTTIVTAPDVAAAAPQANVVSNADNKVVPAAGDPPK